MSAPSAARHTTGWSSSCDSRTAIASSIRAGEDSVGRVATVRRIRSRLASIYGVPSQPAARAPDRRAGPHGAVQSTNDRNRDVAYLRLRERFADWEAVRDAPVDEVEEAIRPGGISKVKSARIQRDPARDRRRRRPARGWRPATGCAEASVREAQAYLCALPGVGRKTAACVLLFAYGLRDVPVDTHVGRVGTRLGCCAARAAVRRAARRDARRSRRAAPSSSCTSTCCATAGAPATRGARTAAAARWPGSALPLG